MAMSTIDPLSYCLQVFVEQDTDVWNVDWLSMGIGFAVALVVGGLIAFGCSRICIKDIAKSKRQDAEGGYMEENLIAPHQKQKIHENQSAPPGGGRRKRAKGARKKALLRKGSAKEDGPESLLPINPVILDGDDDSNDASKGLLDALVKESGVDMESELSNQDLDALARLEKEFREQNIDTMMQLLRTLLNKHMKNGKLTPEQAQDLMKNAQENLDNIIKICQRDKEEEEEELKKKIKDPSKLEGEMDKLNRKHSNILNSRLQEEKERFRQDLSKTTDLTDAEIDLLLAELAQNMANLEHKLGVERMRQAASLEERLAKRRQLAQNQRDEDRQRANEVHYRVESHDQGLQKLVEDHKMTDRQKEELLHGYEEDLKRIQLKHEDDLQKQKLSLAEKLRQRRQAQAAKLAEKHSNQKEKFIKMSDQSVDTEDLVDSYNQLMEQQRLEMDELNDGMDDQEADEMRKLARSIEKERNVEIQQKEEQFEDQIKSKVGLGDKEIDRLMALHQQQMEEFDRQRKEERKRAKALLQDKLARRRMQVEEEQRLALVEQATLKEQQDATLDKVLRSQIELAPGDKEKILKEHEENMAAVNNRLQMSRLRQQKQLEAKLSARRARVDDMKRQVEEAQMSRKKEKEKNIANLQKQIEDEEQKIEDEKKTSLANLREQMNKETQEALSEQEKKINLLISRLQVGQARRQALIVRQDKTIRDLEEKLATRLGDKAEEAGGVEERGVSQQVDHLLQSHMNQVSSLNNKLQDVKDRQNRVIQEKLQQKQLKKEQEIEDKLEYEAQTEFEQQKRRGTAGIATTLLSQTMLESRHKMALNQLEREMTAEMQRQREDLNEELEKELQMELEEQKKSFLAQVAALGDISKEEVTELVESAVVDTGGDENQARKLAKDMRIGIKRAKSEMGMTGSQKKKVTYDRAYDNEGYDEPDGYYGNRDEYDDRGGYYDDEYEQPSRTRSAAKGRAGRPRSAYRRDDDYYN